VKKLPTKIHLHVGGKCHDVDPDELPPGITLDEATILRDGIGHTLDMGSSDVYPRRKKNRDRTRRMLQIMLTLLVYNTWVMMEFRHDLSPMNYVFHMLLTMVSSLGTVVYFIVHRNYRREFKLFMVMHHGLIRMHKTLCKFVEESNES